MGSYSKVASKAREYNYLENLFHKNGGEAIILASIFFFFYRIYDMYV